MFASCKKLAVQQCNKHVSGAYNTVHLQGSPYKPY